MGKDKTKKRKKWHRPRHSFFFRLLNFLARFYTVSRLRFRHFRRGKKLDNRKRPYVIIYNHQTLYDPIVLYQSVRRLPYTVATEDLFTHGVASRVIRFGLAPIPFKKSMNDVGAVMSCIRIVREGYSLTVSAEGSRTFTGETVNINPAIAKLVKMLKVPVAFFVIHGGYSVMPRYADKPRRASGMGAEFRVMEYDEYKDMSVDELNDRIRSELYVDESDDGVAVKSRRRAEYAERCLYLCPVCKSLGRLVSRKTKITCGACGNVAEMDVYRRFRPSFPVKNVGEWIEMQDDWVRALPIPEKCDEILTREKVTLKLLVPKEFKARIIFKGEEARLYPDRFEIGDHAWPFSELDAVTACGKNRVDFYKDGKTYQISGVRGFNPMKYTNLYYHYKNLTEGNDDKFLGI